MRCPRWLVSKGYSGDMNMWGGVWGGGRIPVSALLVGAGWAGVLLLSFCISPSLCLLSLCQLVCFLSLAPSLNPLLYLCYLCLFLFPTEETVHVCYIEVQPQEVTDPSWVWPEIFPELRALSGWCQTHILLFSQQIFSGPEMHQGWADQVSEAVKVPALLSSDFGGKVLPLSA